MELNMEIVNPVPSPELGSVEIVSTVDHLRNPNFQLSGICSVGTEPNFQQPGISSVGKKPNFVLPKSFRHSDPMQTENLGVWMTYCTIDGPESCKKWVAEFSAQNSTSWTLKTSVPNNKNSVCRRNYVCHHSSYRYKESKKALGCTARISIIVRHSIKRTAFQHVKDGLPAVVTIDNNHSHALDTAEAYGHLRPTSDCRATFEGYFNNGLGITESINCHVQRMELEVDESELAKTSILPKYATVREWHHSWQLLHLGPSSGVGVIEKILEKKEVLSERRILLEMVEEPFALVIVTPLMQRAHDLPRAADIVFVDSTASCDSQQHSITFLMTESVAGAIPLGVIITRGQSTADYTTAFNLFKRVVRNPFCGRGCPRNFMTDDSAAERGALSTVFPEANLLLCAFHIGQAFWRWLWDSSHRIFKEDRPHLYKMFKNIVVASTIENATSAYQICLSDPVCNKYPQWLDRVSAYWERNTSWCYAFRDCYTHGNQTNNYCEVTVRLYKDIVLSRCKAYNVVSLIDFTCSVMEKYYVRRLRNFSNGRKASSRLFLQAQFKKAEYLKTENIAKMSDNMFRVPSEQNGGVFYEVDTLVGSCTCEAGKLGNLCKHQAGVLCLMFDPSVSSAEDRYAMAVLALGDKSCPKEFYAPLASDNEVVSEFPSNEPSTSTHSILLESTDQATPVAAGKNEVISEDKDAFPELLNLLQVKYESLRPSNHIVQNTLKKLQRVTNTAQYEACLINFSSQISMKSHSRAKIHVQPTAIARRRPGVTRGSRRLPSGRPPSSESARRFKRKRNLGESVAENRPNAKSHGSGH